MNPRLTYSSTGVLGGAECFAGTRIKVASVVSFINGGVPLGHIMEAFPGLSAGQLAFAQERARAEYANDSEVKEAVERFRRLNESWEQNRKIRDDAEYANDREGCRS